MVKKKVKKTLKIIGIIFGSIFCLLIIFCMGYFFILNNDGITGNDGVKIGYFKTTNPQGKYEKIYTEKGKLETEKIVIKSKNQNIQQYSIYYPKKLKELNKEIPSVIMVNGTHTPASEYRPVLEHLASRGFIVIGNEDLKSGSGESTSITLNFLLKLNKKAEKDNIFYGKIDTNKIGLYGHSQGGAGAINAITKYKNGGEYSSLYTASSIPNFLAKRMGIAYDVSKINIPYFMTAGLGIQDRTLISSLKSLKNNYKNTGSGNLSIMARRKLADHKDMLEYTDAYMTAWFLYTLKDNKDARKVFLGKNPEIIQNTTNWQDIYVKQIRTVKKSK